MDNSNYAPFKMLGHELPGPNQRTPVKFIGAILAASPGLQGAVKKERAKKKLGKTVSVPPQPEGEVGSNTIAAATAKQPAAAATGVAPHGDEAHTGGESGGGLSAAAQPTMASSGIGPFGIPMSMMPQSRGGGMAASAGPWGVPSGWGGVGNASVANAKQATMMAFSDIRLKENIKKTGVSPSGIPIYEFNYIGDNNRYSGAMAQDLLDTDAVSMHDSGYYIVNYNNIDVDMHLIKN